MPKAKFFLYKKLHNNFPISLRISKSINIHTHKIITILSYLSIKKYLIIIIRSNVQRWLYEKKMKRKKPTSHHWRVVTGSHYHFTVTLTHNFDHFLRCDIKSISILVNFKCMKIIISYMRPFTKKSIRDSNVDCSVHVFFCVSSNFTELFKL